MLTLLLSPDWTANTDAILQRICCDVADEKAGRILMVPELISHDTERRLCAAAGDTASRFAEVLTFTRLAKRVADAAGAGLPDCLDNGGRLVAMASATRQLHSKLKAYAAVETRPEFLTGLLDAVDEFKRCCITPQDLLAASQKCDGGFAQKLEELSLILEAYDSLCARGKRDPRDQMTHILNLLEDCSFAADHVFYIDGFPDFTRQHMEILRHLITNSKHIVVSLTCDSINTDNPAFEKAADTAGQLLRIAKSAGIPAEICNIQSNSYPAQAFLPVLYRGKFDRTFDALQVCRAESVYQECHMAAERIISLVQSGCRYRDISIVCADMAAYCNTLKMVLSRYNIPIYQSGTESILDKTVITTVLSAIDAVVDGFAQGDVLRYLKSALSTLDIAACDKLENYAILWNITGNRWGNVWENHPRGLGENWTETDRKYLNELNLAREKAITPLLRLGENMRNAATLGEQVGALYTFLQDVQLDQRLQALAKQMEQDGDLRSAQILNQLWEILLSALEQLTDVLGHTRWDSQTFTKLLKLLLSQYDVGTIPATLDAVMVGPVSAMRCQRQKHLMVLGAAEGVFPGYSGSTGILTDQERTALRQLGVPLTGGAMDGVQAEFAEIYGVFCGASETVCVFCSGGQPSFLYRRLEALAGGETKLTPTGIAGVAAMEVGAYLVRTGAKKEAQALGVIQQYQQLEQQQSHTLGQIQTDTVEKLYGTNLRLSASQIDKLADCRLAYFLRYGLKLQERKTATVDPAEFGTYVHAVLEDTGRRVMELGGFHKVSLEDTLQIANFYSRQYIEERFSQIDSQRLSYLFRRNAQELELVVRELWLELRDSAFEPVDFELAFGPGGDVDAISIMGRTMSAQLRGFVDRVDAWKQGNQVYYRVVDYKTGKKDFDYCDIFNGLGLQMLLYLFALEEHGGKVLGENPVAAGVQYFPARVPVIPLDGKPDEEESCKEREKLWKRKGLLLAEEAVLNAMEPMENAGRSYTRKKDGSVSGDLADRRQLQLLKGYVFALLGKMVDDISSGCVDANPYTRGSRHNACTFCPYGAICHDAFVPGRRDYAAMTQQKFWEEIEKEMKDRG